MHFRYTTEADRRQHYAQIRKVLWVTMALNLLVAGAKVIYGMMTGSLAMKADGYHSTFDAASNIIGLVALSFAAAPPDKEHQYGHWKYEVVASMSISLLLFTGAYTIVTEAWKRYAEHSTPEVTIWSFAIMLGTMGLNRWISVYEAREGKRLGSPVLMADSGHTATDVYASMSVIAALVAAKLGWAWADIIVALVIGLIIFRAAYHIIADGLLAISDGAMLDPKEVHDLLVKSIPEIKEVHKVRTRGLAGHIFMDLHVEVDPNLTIAEGHRVVIKMERQLAKTYPGMTDIVVHLDPYPAEQYEAEEMRRLREEEGVTALPT